MIYRIEPLLKLDLEIFQKCELGTCLCEDNLPRMF